VSRRLDQPPDAEDAYRICFVCTGNICRSPMAAMILRGMAAESALSERLVVTSAGTGPWHEGEPMDPRAAGALGALGYADLGHIARQVRARELGGYDLLVALDRRHLQTLRSLASHDLDGHLALLRSYDPRSGGDLDVPDPYYGDAAEFERCATLIEAGCRGLMATLGDVVPTPPAGPRASKEGDR
jgi:protein-tyrosine phosphatase